MTSNLLGCSDDRPENDRYDGGRELFKTEAFFRLSRRCCFGYLYDKS